MASLIGVSRMQVWRTLHEEDLYPYHDHMVQHLEPGDHAQRMDLCHWMTAHPGLLSVILFTDEASFTRDGINNSRNVHTCGCFKLFCNVWVCVCGFCNVWVCGFCNVWVCVCVCVCVL